MASTTKETPLGTTGQADKNTISHNASPSKRKAPHPTQERPPRKVGKKQKREHERSQGTHEEVLAHDIKSLLSSLSIGNDTDTKPDLPPLDSEIPLKVSSLSSTGSGIAIHDSRPYVLPFAYPGDELTARITRHTSATSSTPAHSTAFPVSVTKRGHDRNDTLVKCKYFGTCSGCQLQPLPYSAQLEHKRTIITHAYENFSNLPKESVPVVAETIGSPLEYGYRTKLTPHFDGPPRSRQARRNGEKVTWERVPEIGFNRADGTKRVLDVEECPIGTESVQRGLTRERRKVVEQLESYKRGATVLLRESCVRVPKADAALNAEGSKDDESTVLEEREDHVLKKTCTSDHRGFTTEYVGDVMFKNPANAFFQNNNSILPRFTQYIRDHVLPPQQTSNGVSNSEANGETKGKITNLIDAYCGSGLFTLTLSSLFSNTLGIDISSESITSATENLKLNNLTSKAPNLSNPDTANPASHDAANPTNPADRTIKFVAGEASSLFASADRSVFKGSNTAVIIDPPRKGCDEGFLRQLREFAPERVVYVSCNVHTQARDVGWLLRGGKGEGEGEGEYTLESLQGFDFFPQTAHVESVAVLQQRH